jgi:hypothetical protein
MSLEPKPTRRYSLKTDHHDNIDSKSFVESILVCTGVYNPQSDLLYHLRNLFNENNKIDSNNNSLDDTVENNETSDDLSQTPKIVVEKGLSEDDLEERKRLKVAMSRKNSFMNYFENKMNIPDVTLDNLMCAVNYIIKKKK